MAKKKTSGKRKSKTSSSDVTTTTTDKRREKRKSEKSDDILIIPLGEHQDLIVPLLMEFLDVPTLVSLGSTDKKNQEHLSEQVARRKSRFKAIQNKISNELLSAEILVPSREKVHQALRLRQEACRLIDSGLGWVDHEYIMDDYDFTSVCSLCSRDRLFSDERKFLKAHRSGDIADHFLMLPTSFYLPKNRTREESSTDGTPPSEELIKRLKDGPLLFLWGAEDHMGSAHESTSFTPFFQDGLFPLRIFSHPSAGFYTNMVDETAERIVHMGQLETFRIAARRFVKERPHSLPCLLLTLVQADPSAAEGDVDSTLSDCEHDLWWSDEELN
jgi:hypothetical protein